MIIDMKQYDVFISYRRVSYDTANLIATRLKAAGYSVFFDIESLRSGKFNEQLYEVIDHCKDFLIVLPPNALDRCVNPDDWVRLEVCRAMEQEKNIIPVLLNGFVWPNPMPEGMEMLCNYQALTANSVDYFDLSLKRLQQQYLRSRRHMPIHTIMKYTAIILVALAALLAILWSVFSVLSRDVCQTYATSTVNSANYVYSIVAENHTLEQDWIRFDDAIKIASRPDKKAQLQKDMLERIDFTEKNIKQAWKVDSTQIDITPYRRFLLSLHGIKTEEVSMMPPYATLYYTDYLDALNNLRIVVDNPDEAHLRYASAYFDYFKHDVNAFYASVLSILSPFPKKSRSAFDDVYKQWIYFPIQLYKIGEKESYYNDIINTESDLAVDIMSRYRSVLAQYDARLDDMAQQLDDLTQQIETTNDEQGGATTSATNKNIHEYVESEQKTLDQEIVDNYTILKKNCVIEKHDDQWNQWDKIIKYGAFLSILVDGRQVLRGQTVDLTSAITITPKMVDADINDMLTTYQSNFPESKDYVSAAKMFFREIAEGSRAYAGILVFAFKDNVNHPFFKVGDIIIEYDGRPVKTYDDLTQWYKVNKSGRIGFLRPQNGHFMKMEETLVNVDIVGFLNLTK